MTYKELYDKALWDLEHDNMTLGEFDRITEPLNKEIPKEEQTDGDLVSRQALLQKMWNDFYKMEDEHEKEQGFEYIGKKRTLEQNGFECAIKTVSEFPSAKTVKSEEKE